VPHLSFPDQEGTYQNHNKMFSEHDNNGRLIEDNQQIFVNKTLQTTCFKPCYCFDETGSLYQNATNMQQQDFDEINSQ